MTGDSRTVNIAARVQGKSKAWEILMTESVVNDSSVEDFFKEAGIIPAEYSTELKGIEGKCRVISVLV